MAVITRTIPSGEKSNDVTLIQQALISLGANIAAGELFTATTAGTYGPSTQTAVGDLLVRFGFARPSPPITFNAQAGRLLNIAVGAEVGASAALRQAVRESFAARQAAPAATPVELALIARYAVIARDFTTAKTIAIQIPNEPVIKDKVGPIVNGPSLQPPAPDLLNPENYYTVLYDYVSKSRINSLLGRA
jgi:peptidoglycan hydrolase-like protein with peptidoglycan-binding domain